MPSGDLPARPPRPNASHKRQPPQSEIELVATTSQPEPAPAQSSARSSTANRLSFATGSDHIINVGDAARDPLDEAKQHLQQLTFPPDLSPQEHLDQAELEQEYAKWMAEQVIRPRRAAFGEGRYELGKDMKAPGSESLLPAAYQAARQFLSSSSRSPVRNALVVSLAPKQTLNPSASGARGELFQNNYDPAVIGGAVGGMTAYIADTVLTSMDRRSKVANMPQTKAVDVKALVPDPGPVVLRIEGGFKRYIRVGSKGAPAAADLKEQAAVCRNALERRQQILSGKAEGIMIQPVFSGTTNALRRVVSSDADLLQPARVFIGSILASGTGGALAKGVFELLKGTPVVSQSNIDNYAGGTQRLNLFKVEPPDKKERPAGLQDLPRLPAFAFDVAKETGAMFARAATPGNPSDFVQWLLDVGWRHGLGNIFASVASPAVGTSVAQIIRNLRPAQPDESLRSSAYILQQFGQSGTNDLFWQMFKDTAKAYDLGGALDRRRDSKSAQLKVEIRAAATQLKEAASSAIARSPSVAWPSSSQLPDALIRAADSLAKVQRFLPSDIEDTPALLRSYAAGWPSHVREAIERLSALEESDQEVSLQALSAAHEALAQWQPRDEANVHTRSELLRALAGTMEPMTRLAAMDAWRYRRPRND